MTLPPLHPADVILTRSAGWLSRGIRWLSAAVWESPAEASHTGLVGEGGTDPTIIEALSTVVERPLWESYRGQEVMVARPLNLSDAQRERIVAEARSMLGAEYGWWKLLAHALDWPLPVPVFRRLIRIDGRPICSLVVGRAFAAVGLDFGVWYRVVQPDDIARFVRGNPGKYQVVREWAKL